MDKECGVLGNLELYAQAYEASWWHSEVRVAQVPDAGLRSICHLLEFLIFSVHRPPERHGYIFTLQCGRHMGASYSAFMAAFPAFHSPWNLGTV